MPSSPPFPLRALAVLAAVITAGLGAAGSAGAVVGAEQIGVQPAYVPDEVIVEDSQGRTRVHTIHDGDSVRATIAELERRPGVRRATPNPIAHISAFIPNDPGRGTVPGGWQQTQWNLLPEAGVNAPDAWDQLIRTGRDGGHGVVVAVLDTGVAYRNKGRFKRSPDLKRFTKGYDFIDDDPYPLDENGHGTHVASTIAEAANNGIGLVGVAYAARIMPVRVLDRSGYGDSVAIAEGIRFAADRHADIINLSFEFPTRVTAGQIPDIVKAIRYARRRGVLIVGSSGNEDGRSIAYPARVEEVLSVGATTEHACQAEYSNEGTGLDLVAPGGGDDADIPSEPNCRPEQRRLRSIYQMTLVRNVSTFGFPGRYFGTSMAAPHVSGVAALVIASGVLGDDPGPARVKARLETTARDLGRVGRDRRYGAGLVDAAAATAPPLPPPAPTPTPVP
jgi:serine protease